MGATKTAPPELDNYEYVRPLGAGGYADVFLYRDKRLGRDVAIKVLHEGQSDAEAKAMAAVSSHASIVEIYETATTPGGRAYIVMQFYPGPTFAERVKVGRLPLHEVLEVGVQLAGALSSAHQLGILHRDIKPANILTSEFNRAGLADFGIASDMSTPDEPTGVSLPWVPPEVLMGSGSDERSDVYALGATLFTLLEGHAPFVHVGGNNSDGAVMARTLNDPIPEVRREDAPASLRALLRATLAREPNRRPETAEQFGRALQAVEVELKLAQTPLDVKRPPMIVPDREVDEDATRGRSVRVITADSIPTGAVGTEARTQRGLIDSVPRAVSSDPIPRVRSERAPAGVAELPPLEDTHVPAGMAPTITADAAGSGTRRWIVLGSIAASVIASVIVAVVIGSSSGHDPTSGGQFVTTSPTLSASGPPAVTKVEVRRNDQVVVWSWTTPKLQPGDSFQVSVTRNDADDEQVLVRHPLYEVKSVPRAIAPCITIAIVRASVVGRPSAKKCAELGPVAS